MWRSAGGRHREHLRGGQSRGLGGCASSLDGGGRTVGDGWPSGELQLSQRPRLAGPRCCAWPLAPCKPGISDSGKVEVGGDPGSPPAAPSPGLPSVGSAVPQAPGIPRPWCRDPKSSKGWGLGTCISRRPGGLCLWVGLTSCSQVSTEGSMTGCTRWALHPCERP